ncbi:hypothetical protein N7540_002261 [Penicillium herquei]|nr:hypothetical protein N7540_002261 [Penicillium herquei]
MTHLITKRKVEDVKNNGGVTAYFPKNVAQLAIESASQAVINADTYAWFATAMYLDQCDWSRLMCAQSTSTSKVTKRSTNQTNPDITPMRNSKSTIQGDLRRLIPRLFSRLELELDLT